MKNKICYSTILLASIMILLSGCGDAKDVSTDDSQKYDPGSDNIADEDNTNTTSDNMYHEFTHDMRDFVEVTYEPWEYPEIKDDKPDYSGYYSGSDGYCELIKQEDGSYYCEFFECRALSYECYAKYESDGVLKTQDDETPNTITIDGDNVSIKFSDETYNGIERKYTPRFDLPDLHNFTGKYTYKKKDGSNVYFYVGYDVHGEAFVNVNYTDTGEVLKLKDFTYSVGSGIYNYSDVILFAKFEEDDAYPDSELIDHYQEKEGDKYFYIDKTGDTPYILLKRFEPVDLKDEDPECSEEAIAKSDLYEEKIRSANKNLKDKTQVTIDKKSEKLYNAFLQGKEKAEYQSTDTWNYLSDKLVAGKEYTLEELTQNIITSDWQIDYYKGFEAKYLDCGLDEKIELLIKLSFYDYNSPYPVYLVVKNCNGKLKICFNCYDDADYWITSIDYNGDITTTEEKNPPKQNGYIDAKGCYLPLLIKIAAFCLT